MGRRTQLTKDELQAYRKKLQDNVYMDKAVHTIADKIAKSLPLASCKKEVIPKTEITINTGGEKKMAKSKLTLNDHLFETLEWLGDRELKGEELREEIIRAEAKCKVAQQIISNNNLILNAAKAVDGFINKNTKLPPMLLGE